MALPYASRPTAPAAAVTVTSRNHLLRSIPSTELEVLRPHLEARDIPAHHTFFARDEVVDEVVFLDTGVGSLFVEMADGTTMEAGTIGCEGMIGISAFLGAERAPMRVDMQVAGRGLVLSLDILRDSLPQTPALHQLLHRYTLALITQLAQVAGCNRMHSLEQRCARWLLQCHDAVDADQFHLTHEFLSIMLGVRRAGVTEAASELQRAGAIRYRRGLVEVSDRARLEACSCECYAVLRDHYARLLGNAN